MRKIWKSAVLLVGALLLMFAMTTMASAQTTEDIIWGVVGYDSDGDVISLGAGFATKDKNGTAIVVTDSQVVSSSARSYLLVAVYEDDYYYLTNPVTYSDLGIAVFQFDYNVPSSSQFVKLSSAKKNTSVTVVYLDEDLDIASDSATITETRSFSSSEGKVSQLTIRTTSSTYAPGVNVIGAFDGNGNLVGLLTSDGNFDVSNVINGGGSSKTTILVIVIAAVLVVVILAVVLLLFRKKKNMGNAGGPQQNFQPSQPNYQNQGNMGTGYQPPVGGETEPYQPAPPVYPPEPPVYPPEPPVKPEISGIAGIAGVMTGRVYPVGADNITIGRDPSCQIRFPAETQGVSRIHVRLFRNGQGEWMLMDCGSSYGTLLQGYGRMMPQHPVPVKVGATFYLGSEQNGFTLR